MKSYNGFSPKERMEGDRLIKQAIKDGILKPLNECSCVLCGQDKGIRHYHCEDYSPQNVVQDAKCLCWRCHMILHSRFRHKEAYINYIKEVKSGKRYEPVYRNDFRILEENGIKYENRRNANK